VTQDPVAIARAVRTLRCLPFRRSFYESVDAQPLSSTEFCHRAEAAGLARCRLSRRRAEDHFLWLIRIGVLRREVDGQGLTERVRLTPLGRSVLQRWPGEIPVAAPLERLGEWCRRHRPRP
jgi:hypothetical protein